MIFDLYSIPPLIWSFDLKYMAKSVIEARHQTFRGERERERGRERENSSTALALQGDG